MSNKYSKYKTPDLEKLLIKTPNEVERKSILAELKVRYFKEVYSQIQPPKEKKKGCLGRLLLFALIIVLSFVLIT